VAPSRPRLSLAYSRWLGPRAGRVATRMYLLALTLLPLPTDATKATAETPPGDVANDYPRGHVSRWLPGVRSFQLRAECRDERGPEQVLRNLYKLKRRFPDLKDPDPLVFTELLPVTYSSIEGMFDPTRFRFYWSNRTTKNVDLSRRVHIWHGKSALSHQQYYRSKQNDFVLSPTSDYVKDFLFSYINYLHRQPPAFWWNKSLAAQERYEEHEGTPSDYIFVDRVNYHGVDCNVLLKLKGNRTDRYYGDVKDGRWYGAKEGIIAFPDFATYWRNNQQAIKQFLGISLGENPSREDWNKVAATIRSLPRDKKIAWARLSYSRFASQLPPAFEYWFSDYRELGNGKVFPFREDFLLYDHEGNDHIFVSTRRTVTIKEIRIDQPLDDHLFQEPLMEGAAVADLIHQPPLYYKHKNQLTPEEWRQIVNKATERDQQDAGRRQKITQLIGKPAPPLPAGEWLNSKPLAWADLRGKIVILKFWAVNCAPCYNEIAALSGTADRETDSKKSDKKPAETPIVYIGVHTLGTHRKEIEKVASKYKLAAPICIDREGTDKSSWGEFFTGCQVYAMPTSVAVDEQGRILAHGTFSEAVAAAFARQRAIANYK
jgi:hypothetical protein